MCASKKRCVLGDLRGLKTAPKQTCGTNAHSQRQISFKAEAQVRWEITCSCTVTKQVFQRTVESKSSWPRSKRIETYTLSLPWKHQSDRGRQAEAGRTQGMGWWWEYRKREMVEVALAGWLEVKCVVHLIIKELQKVLPEGNFDPKFHLKVVMQVEASKIHRR